MSPATPATGGGSRRLASSGLISSWRWIAYVAVGLLTLPFIVRQNSWFEWANALWLLDLQTAHVAAHGVPTYFIDGPGQYFYPFFVFYGGPLYSLLAYPSVLFGSWPVFAAVTAGAFVATAAGIGWTARNLGVPSRLAILPGLLFALTPYTVSNLYGRGAWTEVLAIGALSVALGAATSLTSGGARNRALTTAALAVAVAAIAGTHNITLLFSALMAPLLGLALLPLLGGSRRELIERHLLVLAGAVTGIAICGAFLIPDVWLSGRTIASTGARALLHALPGFDSAGTIFSPTASQPAGVAGTDLHTQTLVVPLLWILLVAAILAGRRRLARPAGLALTVLGLGAVTLALLITHPAWWLSFPATMQAIQFPFRLVSYLALLTALGVVVLLTIPAIQRSRLTILALLLACGWQAGLAVDMAVTAKPRGGSPPPSPDSINAAAVPPAFAPGLLQARQFRLLVARPLSPVGAPAAVASIGDDTPPEIALSGTQPPGSLVATNVVASPLIQVTGQASVAGASAEGFEVLRVSGDTPWRARVAPACNSCLRALSGNAPIALLLGKLASAVGLLALALLGALALGARAHRPPLRLRRSRRGPSATD